jgi:ribonuclease BN (tRNA processing enzyme)
MPSRRAFLTASGAFVAGLWAKRDRRANAQTQNPRTRLILLGTAGGPTPKINRAAPAQAIVIGSALYLVDCGDGVARQLTLARLAIRQLSAVFITHQHSDHNAGYGSLFLLGWTAGLDRPVDTYGPPPLANMTRLLLQANEFDIKTRIEDEGRPPLEPLIRPHEITAAGEVFKDDRVHVTAAINQHPPIEYSFAYRFDSADRSIVVSGDTRYSEAVVELAQGADVLVHEVMYRAYFERPDAPQPPAVRRHILASHTDAEDVGRVASQARVRKLVLSHFVPSDPPEAVSEAEWLAAVRKRFSGEVILGKDLMEI